MLLEYSETEKFLLIIPYFGKVLYFLFSSEKRFDGKKIKIGTLRWDARLARHQIAEYPANLEKTRKDSRVRGIFGDKIMPNLTPHNRISIILLLYSSFLSAQWLRENIQKGFAWKYLIRDKRKRK